jgi:flagellar hook protein FlgE
MTMGLDFGTGLAGLTQYADASTAVFQDQNGFTMGTLIGKSIDRTGTVMGTFSNGIVQPLAQVSLASFTNPSGLERQGDNLYVASGNSGEPVLGYSREGNDSTVQSGALEMSNVDLAQEFTNMIIAQRGFQASSRVITTSDEMLQEVVGLKR